MDLNKLKVVFLGTPEFAVSSLRALLEEGFNVKGVVTQTDKVAGRNNLKVESAVKKFAVANNIPVYQPAKLKEVKDWQFLLDIKPDLLVVVAYGKILPLAVLNIAKMGAINVHASLLPKYRGASPIQASLLNGDTETGITIMQLDEGMDTGPILMQEKVDISKDDTASSLGYKLSQKGSVLLVKTIKSLIVGQIEPKLQSNDLASICRIIKKEDGKINWNQKAIKIEQKVRAYNPWPSVWTEWHSEKMRIKILKCSSENMPSNTPGLVIAQGKDVMVECADNSVLKIKEIQPENKKPMAISSFLNGHKNFIGSILS